MALEKCKECGNDVSTEAKTCPKCGAKPPKKTSTLTWIFGVVFAFGIGSAVLSDGAPSKPAKTPEQIAADNLKELAFQKTFRAAAAVKSALRDPDSLTWEDIRSNDDASIICLEYRAKNGFGGMNKEFVVYVRGAPSQKVAAWNKNCTQPLTVMKHVKYALK